MCNHRWGGLPEGGATRVEFQLRGEQIKEILGTTDYEVVRASRAKLIEWVTDQWCRFTEEPVDRENKHQSRAVVSKLWQSVVECFQAWAGAPTEALVRPQRQIKVNTKQLEQQLADCLPPSWLAPAHYQNSTRSPRFVKFIRSLLVSQAM